MIQCSYSRRVQECPQVFVEKVRLRFAPDEVKLERRNKHLGRSGSRKEKKRPLWNVETVRSVALRCLRFTGLVAG